MDQEILNQSFPNYTLKDLAVWDDATVCYLDVDVDYDTIVVCEPRNEGVQRLANRWDHFHHVGVVPTRPIAGSGTSMATVGAARGQCGLAWTVDSGAGLHMANKH